MNGILSIRCNFFHVLLQDTKKCGKLEQKIKVMTQGYAIIADKLDKACKRSYGDFDKAAIEFGEKLIFYEMENNLPLHRLFQNFEAE